MSGHNTGAVLEGRITHRGTSNSNDRGNSTTRRQRREWLVETYRANVDLPVDMELLSVHDVPSDDLPVGAQVVYTVPLGEGEPCCRCYRCGELLTVDTVTADRIKPGAEGGTYGTPRRDKRQGRTNVRPACGDCNSSTGGHLAAVRRLS